jgi:hypothetical protein
MTDAAVTSETEQSSLSAEKTLAGRKILIIVENLPVPFDRRVWQESLALVAAGAEVSVICPKGKGYEAEEEDLEGRFCGGLSARIWKRALS